MNNYVYFAINSFIKAAHQNAVNGTPVSNSSSEPAGTIQLSATDDSTWTIDKTYQDLKNMYARGRLTGLSWHRSEDSIIFVPLTSTGMVDGHDSFVFSTILTTQGSSSFHSFIVPDEGERLIYVTEDVGVETSFEVVEELVEGHPKVDNPSTKIIYLYKDPNSAATDPYTEWIYTRDGEWEIIGETSLDLSGYYTSAQVDVLLGDKADKVESAVAGNFAGFDGNGNLTDSGSKASDFKTKQSSVNVEGLGTTKTITSLTQNDNGVISATASDIQSATTSQAGIVQLNDSTDSASTSQAATANAVKKAYDHADALVAGLDAEVTSNDGTNVQVKVTQVDGIVTGVNITKDTSANAESVAQALAALDAEVTSSDGTNVQVKVTEVDGVVTAVNVTTDNTVNSTDVNTAVTDAIGGLDVSDLVQDSSGSMAGKTLLTLNESNGKIGATFQNIQITESQVTGLTGDLSSKVDKVTGKGLSTEDYTTEEKAKLSGIETGAQVNIIESVKVDGTALSVDANKAVDIPLASATESGNETVYVTGVVSGQDKQKWDNWVSDEFPIIPAPSSDTIIIEGKEYKYVKIGNQLWLAENLDSTFTGIADNPSGDFPLGPCTWYYNRDASTYGPSGQNRGRLYTTECIPIINDALPDGWHVPTKSDYDTLFTFCGLTPPYGNYQYGYSVFYADRLWDNTEGLLNDYGLGLIPTGRRTSNTYDASNVCMLLTDTDTGVSSKRVYWLHNDGGAYLSAMDKYYDACAIRLVKNLA